MICPEFVLSQPVNLTYLEGLQFRWLKIRRIAFPLSIILSYSYSNHLKWNPPWSNCARVIIQQRFIVFDHFGSSPIVQIGNFFQFGRVVGSLFEKVHRLKKRFWFVPKLFPRKFSEFSVKKFKSNLIAVQPLYPCTHQADPRLVH